MVSLWKGGEPHLFWCHLVKGQRHRYYEYNFWLQGRFRTIDLVLYIGSLKKIGHMISLWVGKNPIYFGGH
jgi:hypothetical protein